MVASNPWTNLLSSFLGGSAGTMALHILLCVVLLALGIFLSLVWTRLWNREILNSGVLLGMISAGLMVGVATVATLGGRQAEAHITYFLEEARSDLLTNRWKFDALRDLEIVPPSERTSTSLKLNTLQDSLNFTEALARAHQDRSVEIGLLTRLEVDLSPRIWASRARAVVREPSYPETILLAPLIGAAPDLGSLWSEEITEQVIDRSGKLMDARRRKVARLYPRIVLSCSGLLLGILAFLAVCGWRDFQ